MKLFVDGQVFDFPDEKLEKRMVAKGDYLFREGEVDQGIYWIKSGEVKILKDNKVLWLALDHQLVGVSTHFSQGGSYRFSAKAGETTEYYRLHKDAFEELIASNSSFGKIIINTLCERVKMANSRLETVINGSSKVRLIKELLRKAKESNSRLITYSLEDLSEFVGVSTRLIKKILKELEKKMILSFNRNGVEIQDIRGLESTLKELV